MKYDARDISCAIHQKLLVMILVMLVFITYVTLENSFIFFQYHIDQIL